MTSPLTYKRPTAEREIAAKPGTCGACRWWTPPTAFFHGTCHNTKAGLGAHIQSGRDSTCNHHEAKAEQEAGKK